MVKPGVSTSEIGVNCWLRASDCVFSGRWSLQICIPSLWLGTQPPVGHLARGWERGHPDGMFNTPYGMFNIPDGMFNTPYGMFNTLTGCLTSLTGCLQIAQPFMVGN